MRHQKHSAESLGGGSQAKPCNAAVANQHGLRCYSHHQRLSLSVLPLEENWWQSGCHRKEHKKRHGKATTSGKMRPKACQRHFSVDNHRISHPRLFYLSILKRQGSSRLEQSELSEYTLAKSEQLIHRFFMATLISVRATSVSKCELTGTDTNQTIIHRHHLSYNPHHRSTYLHPFGFQWLLAQSLRAIDGASSQYCVPWNQSLGDGLAVSVLSSTCRFFSKPEIPALHFLLQPLVDTLHCDALLPQPFVVLIPHFLWKVSDSS